MNATGMSGPKKAAILLKVLGTDNASFILQRFKDPEIEVIIKEMISEETIDGELIEDILQEAHIHMYGQEGSNVRNQMRAGLDYARDLLGMSFGQIKSQDMMERLGIEEDRYFDFITDKDIDKIASFLSKQLPQTIALVLLHMKKEHVGKLLGALPSSVQAMVVNKTASIRKVDSETIAMLRKTLEELLEGISPHYKFGGTVEAADILKRADASVKNEILENLDVIDANLRDELEKQMFRFEGLNLLDDEGLQAILKSTQFTNEDLAYALKSCPPRLKERILNSMPPNRREDIEYELETMGRVRLWKVEQAQQRILEEVQKLVDQGEISLEEGDFIE